MASSDASSSTVYRSDSAATSDSQQTAATTASLPLCALHAVTPAPHPQHCTAGRSAAKSRGRCRSCTLACARPRLASVAAQQTRLGLFLHGACIACRTMQKKPSSSTCWAHAPCAMRQGHIGLQPRRRRRGRQQRCLGWIWRERACPSRILQRSPHSASCRATTCTTGCMGRALLPMKARR